CFLSTKEHVAYHFRVLSHPEVLTWKEYRRWFRIFKKRQRYDRVIPILTASHVPVEKRREFLRAIMQEREQALSLESEATTHQQRESHMAKALTLTDDCLWFAEANKLFWDDSPFSMILSSDNGYEALMPGRISRVSTTIRSDKK